MRLRLLAMLVALLTLLPSPARAEICDRFAQQMDPFEVDTLASQVRDGFPTMYRHVLDQVALRISDEPGYQTYFENTPGGGEITVPNYMPKYICTVLGIAIGSQAIEKRPIDAQQLARMNAAASPCPPGQVSDQCLLPTLEILYATMEPQLAAAPPEYLAVLPFLVREAVKIALAHEYGHAIIDYGYPEDRRRMLSDHETEADLLALHPQVSSRTAPMATTFMYASMLMVERINKQSRRQTGVHDLTACRLLRLQSIQRTILPGIDALSKWQPGRVPPAIGPAANVLSSRLEESGDCPMDIPREVLDFRSDLEAVHAILATLPAQPPTTGSFESLAAFQPRTLLGDSVRNSLIMRGALAIEVPPLLDTKDAAMRERALVQIGHRRNELDRVATDPLPSSSTRDFVSEYALAQFMQHPPGTKIKPAAREFVNGLRAFDAFMTATPKWLVQRTLAEILAGDCRAAADSAAMARFHMQKITDEYGSLVQALKVTIDALPPPVIQLADHLEAVERGEVKFDKGQCAAIRAPMVTVLTERLGWVD